jgi:ribonuclease BN (tRNA processing enzyme)
MRLNSLVSLKVAFFLISFPMLGNAAEPATPRVEKSVAATPSLILLGTAGGPVLRATRSQPASMLVVNGTAYLIDVGDGVSEKVVKSGYSPAQVQAVFVTHHHMDHTAGLGAFVGFNWSVVRKTPLHIYGPPGVEALVQRGLSYYAVSEETFGRQTPSPGKMANIPKPVEISSDGKFYEDENIRVFAAENSHFSSGCGGKACSDLKAFSYRFEVKGGEKPFSIVFTGDTGPSDKVVELAKGADVLVSEVIDLASTITFLKNNRRLPEATLQSMIAHMEMEHLTPEEVGKLAKASSAKKLVLHHFVWGNHEREPDVKKITDAVAEIYGGPIIPGYDMQLIALEK